MNDKIYIAGRVSGIKYETAKRNFSKAENKALKKENDEFRQWVEKLETRLGCNVVNEPHDGSTKGALKRFFGWFKRKKWL